MFRSKPSIAGQVTFEDGSWIELGLAEDDIIPEVGCLVHEPERPEEHLEHLLVMCLRTEQVKGAQSAHFHSVHELDELDYDLTETI